MNFLITTVFIAEIIIATTIILHIVKFTDKIQETNKKITLNKVYLIAFIRDFKIALEEFRITFENTMNFLIKRQEEYFFGLFKSMASSIVVMLLRGKYKKLALCYQLISIVKESYEESQNC